jgi:hypothetical protein
MRSQETAKSPVAARSTEKYFTGSIGNDQAHLAAVLGRAGVEEAADGVDGLTTFADDAGQVGLPGLHGVDVFAVHRSMREENLVGMAGEAAQDEVEELLHEG